MPTFYDAVAFVERAATVAVPASSTNAETASNAVVKR